jgi:NADPH:quinone reductase
MRAVMMRALGAPPEIHEVPVPDRATGHTLVRISAATVGHLDASIASGNFMIHPAVPYIPGVEGAGIVMESDVWNEGEAVCVRGAGVGLVRDGTWSQVAHVPDDSLTNVPSGMDMALAACYFVPVTTAFVTVHDLAHISEGMTVAVTGAAGVVGGLVTQLALEAGATVLAVTRKPHDWQGPYSERLIVRDHDADLVAEVGQVDHLIDTIGGADLQRRIRWVRPGGSCFVIGYAAGAQATLDLPNFIVGNVSLVPVNMLEHELRAREVSDQLADQLVRGQLRLDVTEYPLDQAAKAIADVAQGSLAGRATLRCDS